jgi:hypothetical protein
MMMAGIASSLTGAVMGLLNGAAGGEGNGNIAALTAGALSTDQIWTQNVGADLAEKANLVRYPVVQIYCEKLVNSLTEKFRSFSGTAQMVIEIRHSQDRLEGLQDALESYADAATALVNGSRGDWGNGMFYGGGYEVAYSAVKKGGKNFIQVTKVTFKIGVSRS